MVDKRIRYKYLKYMSNADVPGDCHELPFVCLRPDGRIVYPKTPEVACKRIREKYPDFFKFHFHSLRHTYTTNMIVGGANPKDVQEMLGHSDINMTLNIYTHATRNAKRNAAKLLDNL